MKAKLWIMFCRSLCLITEHHWGTMQGTFDQEMGDPDPKSIGINFNVRLYKCSFCDKKTWDTTEGIPQ